MLKIMTVDEERTSAPLRALIERTRAVLSDDPRVLGVWLSGSFGSGSQDA